MTGNTAGEQPILVGFTTGLNAVEIAEALVADPQGAQDTAPVDEANRKVYPDRLYSMNTQIVDGDGIGNQKLLIIHDYPRIIEEGQNFQIFAFNQSGGALMSGTIIRFVGVAVLEWLRD